MNEVILFDSTGIQTIHLENVVSDPDSGIGQPVDFVVEEDHAAGVGDGTWRGCLRQKGDEPSDEIDSPDEVEWDDDVGARLDGGHRFEENVAASQTVSATPLQGIELLQNRWFEFPYQSSNPHWCRGFIRKVYHGDSDGMSIHVTLACDTKTRSLNLNDGHSLLNAELGGSMSPAPSLMRFWKHESVIRAVEELVSNHRSVGEFSNDRELYINMMARAQAALIFLSHHLPAIKVLTQMGADENVQSTLVLDMGNCRTSGVIVDESGGDFCFAQLELKSLNHPGESDFGVFESWFQFVDPSFQRQPFESEQTPNFQWHSLIRLGRDARRAALLQHQDPQSALQQRITGMSSPKRYLWDSDAQAVSWRPASRSSSNETIRGSILRHLSVHDPFRELAADEPIPPSAPTDAKHPRKVGLVFMLFEILTQAYAQINSHRHRASMPVSDGYNRRRDFSKIILMYASGMSPQELEQYQRGAQRAVDLWHMSINDPARFDDPSCAPCPPIIGKPTVSFVCDEASAVQLCYLYGELREGFKGKAREFFRIMGKERNELPTLRVASLDIGGGTTDFVIVDYALDTSLVGAPRIKSTTRFVDGISIAGDDIGYAILIHSVFPQLCQELGIQLAQWFASFQEGGGAATDEDTKAWRRIRPQLVQHVWIPIVRYLWNMLERGETDSTVRIRDVFETRPPDALLEQLNKLLSRISERDRISIQDVTIRVQADQLIQIIRQVLYKPLAGYCDIIAQFDCDLLLLAGRPSGLPAIQDILVQLCPVGPGRMVALQGHPVDKKWFPFASKDDRIEDAKFCSVVGAMLAYLARNLLLGDFILEVNDQREHLRDTLIHGIANPDGKDIPADATLFRPNAKGHINIEEHISFGGLTWIGVRRIDSEAVPVNPLYKLRWHKSIRDRIASKALMPRDIVVTLERPPQKPWELRIKKTSGKVGQADIQKGWIELKLQTIFEDEYWLDTGCFKNPHASSTYNA